jgi:hypothetical protein
MKDLVRLFADIALLRRGPEDLPASLALLLATLAAFFLANLALNSVFPPLPGPWLGQLVVAIGFTLVWYALLLAAVRRKERFLQTATALFGYQTVLAPLWIAAVWMVGRYRDDPPMLFPVSLVGLAVLIWTLTVNVRILRSALEWPIGSCVAIVVLQTVARELLLIGLFAAGHKPA